MKRVAAVRKDLSALTDARVKLCAEIVSGDEPTLHGLFPLRPSSGDQRVRLASADSDRRLSLSICTCVGPQYRVTDAMNRKPCSRAGLCLPIHCCGLHVEGAPTCWVRKAPTACRARHPCSAVCAGIKAIKLHAWEEAFLERMRRAREPELEQARCAAVCCGSSACISSYPQCCVEVMPPRCTSQILPGSMLSAVRCHV